MYVRDRYKRKSKRVTRYCTLGGKDSENVIVVDGLG